MRCIHAIAALALLGLAAIDASAQTQLRAPQRVEQLGSGVGRLVPGFVAPGQRGLQRPGEATEAEGAVTAPPPIGQIAAPTRARRPFGAQIFDGAMAPPGEGANPDYRIVPGDQIAVRIWGATTTDISGPVDLDGNIFLPDIGPMRVAGLRAGELQQAIAARVRQVYPTNVEAYATLLGARRIGVFVTGFVVRPGRHLGSAQDSVLDFLVRAGGVDVARGSYRDITVQRRGRVLARIDLYRFLIDGHLPALQLAEGDTIVVARQRGLVEVDGSARNDYLFELPNRAWFTGRELAELARPLPSATHAVVVGTRGQQPFSRYVPLAAFAQEHLRDQDRVTFLADAPAGTVTVTVEGSRIGPSVLVAERGTTLPTVLDHVAVDPRLADTANISILRRSVAAQQKRAINEALDRLERALFLGTAITEGEAAIRAAEARLVAEFIARARTIEPEGRLVVAEPPGRIAALRVEDGDVILIPEVSQTVLVAGEVQIPQALLWRRGASVADYVARAGGYSPRADEGAVLIRRANGELVMDWRAQIRPGDEIIILPRIETKYFQLAKDITQILFQIAGAVRIFTLD
jgi:protein involved in polysaccharide export with SLBB domain